MRGGMDAGWKSAILAASLGAVVLGGSILSHSEGRTDAVAAQAIAAQAPVVFQIASNDGSVILVPAMPQRPVFTQPITRSRAS